MTLGLKNTPVQTAEKETWRLASPSLINGSVLVLQMLESFNSIDVKGTDALERRYLQADLSDEELPVDQQHRWGMQSLHQPVRRMMWTPESENTG